MPNPRTRAALFLLCFAGLLLAGGMIYNLSQPRGMSGSSANCVTWGLNEVGVGGIDSGGFDLLSLCFKDTQWTQVGFWGDGHGSTAKGGTDKEKAYQTLTMTPPSNRAVVAEVELWARRICTIRIDGRIFDPSRGRLFLIQTQRDKPRILQLSIEPESIPKDADQRKTFARDNPQIRQFFENREP